MFSLVPALLPFSLLLFPASLGNPVVSPPPCQRQLLLGLGQGGGFTGALAGFRIFADGSVEKWRQVPGKKEEVHPLGKLTSPQLKQLQEISRHIPWQEIPQGSPGNVFCFLQRPVPEGTAEVVWPGLWEDAPQPLRPLLDLLLPWLQSLEP